MSIKERIYTDWSVPVPPPQSGGWSENGNTLAQQLGLDSTLEGAEAKITQQLKGKKYTSIQFATQTRLTYNIVSRDRQGQPVTPQVGWHASLALVVTATDPNGKVGYIYLPLRSTDGGFTDERYANYDYPPPVPPQK